MLDSCGSLQVNAWRHDALEIPGAYAKLRVWRHTEVAMMQLNQKAVLLKGCLGDVAALGDASSWTGCEGLCFCGVFAAMAVKKRPQTGSRLQHDSMTASI